ncbi:MAG: glycoside hydrolase family 32 protein [Tepidisphaeraceae bacterium]
MTAAVYLAAFACLATLAVAAEPLPTYTEKYRPQFHFTAARDWLNDPNGLVYYEGEYHLFFQRRVGKLLSDGNMTWGHAVSTDLMHWRELPDAITPDEHGSIWSGSAVVDWNNTTGFGKDGKPPLVAMYTAAKDPFSQHLAYSTDKGRTWTKYVGNPVLPNIHGKNRDPKVIWHEPTKKWVMALYLDRRHEFAIFDSPDLKNWTKLQDVTLDGDDECPDFFPLPLDGDKSKIKWVFTGANARYVVGTFDGKTFTRETDVMPSEFGGSYYAAQTYSDTPDGRRIQIGWLRRDGVLPDNMPFNQQMSVPCELTLKSTPRGPRLFRYPVRELEDLANGKPPHVMIERPLGKDDLLLGVTCELLDFGMRLVMGSAKSVTLNVRGHPITLHAEGKTVALTGWDRRVSLPVENGQISLRVLIDRTSIEVFTQNGSVVLSGCFLPPDENKTISLTAQGGEAAVFCSSQDR